MTILLFAATFILGVVCGWNIYNRLNAKDPLAPKVMYEDGCPGSRVLFLNIAGINHRDGIEIYMGRLEVVLIPEPSNPHDPMAIKVVAAEDGHHLGYVAKEMTAKVREVTHNRFPRNAWAVIQGREEDISKRRFFVGEVTLKY